MELVTNPEQELANAPDVTLRPLPFSGDYKNLARAAIEEGLLWNQGNKLEAGARSYLTGEPYEDIRQRIRDEQAIYSHKNPVESAAAQVVGGFLPAILASMATPATGGATAPIAGAALARNAGALNTLGEALQIAKNARGSNLGIAKNAKDVSTPALGGYNISAPEFLTGPFAKNTAFGTLAGAVSGEGGADIGKEGEGSIIGGLLGGGISAATHGIFHGGTAAYRWLADKMASSPESIKRVAAGALERAGVSPEKIMAQRLQDEAQGITHSSLLNLDPAAEKAALLAAKESPEAAEILARSGELAQKKSADSVLKQNRTHIGNDDYYGSIKNINNRLETEGTPLYEKAHAFGTVNDPRINNLLNEPEFANYFEKAKKIARADELAAITKGEDPSKYQLKNIYAFKTKPDGEIIGLRTSQLPDARTLDYMKRAMDDDIHLAYTTDKSVLAATAPALQETRKAFLKIVDDAVPDYAAARKLWNGEKSSLTAGEAGRKEFSKLDHEEVADLYKSFDSAAEREAFKAGALRDLYGRVMDSPEKVNAAKEVLGSAENQKKLQVFFDSPEKYNLYKSALERESQLYHNAQKSIDLEKNIKAKDKSADAKFLIDTITGGPQNGLVKKALDIIGSSRLNDKTAQHLAVMLGSENPTNIAAAVKAIEDIAAKNASSSATVSSTAGTFARGVTVGLTEPSDDPRYRNFNPQEAKQTSSNEITDEQRAYIKNERERWEKANSPKR
jgi:hypothetical protein